MRPLDRMVRDIENLKKAQRALATGPQLANSSLENGTLDVNDADGNLRMMVGLQDDGRQTVTVIGGPTPPTPSAPQVSVDNGTIVARWDGNFVDELVAPTDWARTEIHAVPGAAEFVPTRATARDSIVAASGGEVTIGVEKGTWTVCLVSWSQAGKLSPASGFVTVEVPSYGDLVQESIDKAQELIDQAKAALEAADAELSGKLSEVEGELESIPQDIATARQEAIDAALAEIDTVEGNLTTALGLKNKTTWSTSNPPTTYTGAVEDTWIKLTSLGSGGREIGRWRWNGNVWVTHVIDGAVLSNIDASTITTGFLDVVNRIRAGAILADKVLVGGPQNLLPDPTFVNLAAGWPVAAGSATHWSVVDDGGPTVEGTANGTGWVELSSAPIAARPGDSFVAEIEGRVVAAWPTRSPAFNIWFYDANMTRIPPSGGTNFSSTSTSWAAYQNEKIAPAGTAYVRIALSVASTATAGSKARFRNPRLRSRVGGTLITPGGIQTPHLAADVMEVGNLKAGTAALAEAVIQKLWAEVVVARMVTAQEFIGENAILTGAVTASKITASEELWAKIGEFVRIRTGMLEADAIDGMVITGATIQTARTGARVTQDASGIAVYDDADDWRVRLTPYGSTFKGDLEAESLVATGPAEFRHTDNRLGQGAKLVLEAGVTDPTAPPVVQPYWASVGFTPPEGGVLYGLAYADGKYWTFVDVPNASEVDRLISIDPATGAIGDNIPMTDQFWAAGGVTAIGSELFLLGQKSGTPYKYFVRVYSTAGAFLREWEYTDVGWSKTNPLTYKPGIGTDGTNVVIAQCTDNGSLRWRTYNPSTGALLATVDCKDQTKSDIGGIYIGPGDWGGGTFVTVRKTSGNVGDAIVTFSTSGVWDPAKSWKTAENGRDTGLAFADGKFRTLNGGGGRINEYAPPTTGDDSPDWWVAYRWETDFDSDNALDYTSRISPPTRFTWPRRARLKALGSPLPVGVETIGGFTAKKATTPERTDFRRSFTNTQQGKSVALWHYLDSETTVPAEVNTYPTATPSSIASASSTFEVRGDGTGRWGPLTFNPNGTVTGVPKVASGVVQLNVPSNNGRVSATVTLPAGRFTTKPAIQVTARTAWPVVHAATFTDETTTSFVVWARRDTAGPLDVAWTAIGE
ncbi:hypothetical protein [Brevibacterium casei]|uniref:hypothetical protein n=1 Tax=Brevibacterium casei TaxID=33889 RepID=UPI00241EAADB|nr:hypothetical protein [Brevibacterium casei]